MLFIGNIVFNKMSFLLLQFRTFCQTPHNLDDVNTLNPAHTVQCSARNSADGPRGAQAAGCSPGQL